MHIQKNEDQRSAGSKRRTGGHNRSLRSLPSSLTRPVNILSAGNKNIRLSIINCIDWVRPVRYTYTLQCRCIKILRYTLSLRRRHLVNIIANRNAVMNGRTSLALAETIGPVDAIANRRSLSASIVVLDESPCPRGSPRTNLQALVLDSRVLLLVFVLGLQLSPWEFSRTVCVYETVNVWNGHVIGALTHWHWLAYINKSVHNCCEQEVSYRRGTARRAVSVETVRNVSQMFLQLHLISSATGDRMTLKIIQGHWRQHKSIGHRILPTSGVY